MVTVIATQIRYLLDPVLGSALPFATYLAGVVIVTWYGGWGPSLLTLTLGWLLADYHFIAERGVFFKESALDLVGGGVYWFVGLTIILLGRNLAAAKNRAEAIAWAVQEREERLRLAIATTGLGTWDFDPLNGRLELSRESKKISGLEPSVAAGYAEAIQRVHPDDRVRFDQKVRSLASNSAAEGEEFAFRILRPDATVRHVVAQGKLFKNQAGQVIRCIGTLLDVTEQQRFEAELMQQTDELKRKTHELIHTNEELEQFARLIAHDLRTPLVTLSLNAGLLSHLCHEKMDPEVDEILDCIMQQTNRISRMITGLQNYSQLDAVPAGGELCDSEAALEQALADLSETIEDSQAQVTHRELLPAIIGDQAQFAELLKNLIENAIKFRRDIPPRIDISATMHARETCFAVRDNGVGILPQNFERIFQIFQCLDKNDLKNNSLGLGLATCKKIVERYGGKIWVQSAPEQGSTFYFSFPNPPSEPESVQVQS